MAQTNHELRLLFFTMADTNRELKLFFFWGGGRVCVNIISKQYLGVFIYHKLKWCEHISYIKN